jgi:hypothetical protein
MEVVPCKAWCILVKDVIWDSYTICLWSCDQKPSLLRETTIDATFATVLSAQQNHVANKL